VKAERREAVERGVAAANVTVMTDGTSPPPPSQPPGPGIDARRGRVGRSRKEAKVGAPNRQTPAATMATWEEKDEAKRGGGSRSYAHRRARATLGMRTAPIPRRRCARFPKQKSRQANNNRISNVRRNNDLPQFIGLD